ncbi:serine hydrolase [uncultured Schumannella sp.]|uniref:serine hydrolase domain-containing protein n=1 Tax=uncultured Schumannella sp. TaxID=1195956 RepID=UPI0025F28381|nr:serine hydrolase domain-containing protein [uncultured Schumannella sp.]
MLRNALTILAIGASTVLPATAVDDAINDVIDRELAASAVPGVAYAAVTGGELTASGARGVERIGDDAAVTADTPFEIGSVSKSFTALAVMQLVEAGEVELDAPLSGYLADFAGHPAGAITVRELLSHTSGFSTLQGNAAHSDATGAANELELVVDQLVEVTPAYPAGEHWEYSNTNYQILGRLLEVVSGQDFSGYLTTHILDPIGMRDSFVADGEIHDEMATGHRPWFGTKIALAENATDRATAPQGGVIASANDVARYLQVMMNGEDDVLSAAGKAQMMRPASDASPFYGFGWFIDSATGAVSHSGSTPGFESLATMIPAEGAAVVVLVNGGSGLGFGETAALRDGITAAALGFDQPVSDSGWGLKALFLGMVALPIFYLGCLIWAWTHRSQLRAKRTAGVAGLFSLWFPLLTTIAAAWALLVPIPAAIGAPLGTLNLFQPDLGLLFVASAVTGVLWSGLRLAVAYTRARDRT